MIVSEAYADGLDAINAASNALHNGTVMMWTFIYIALLAGLIAFGVWAYFKVK